MNQILSILQMFNAFRNITSVSKGFAVCNTFCIICVQTNSFQNSTCYFPYIFMIVPCQRSHRPRCAVRVHLVSAISGERGGQTCWHPRPIQRLSYHRVK